MKTTFYFLLVMLLGDYCYGQDVEKLPTQPWEELVEMNNNIYYKNKRWKKDINVELEGSYTKEDSLHVKKILKKFDSITETISIKLSNFPPELNFKIRFIDSIIPDTRLDESNYYHFVGYEEEEKSYFRARVFIYKNYNKDFQLKNTLEAKFASFLVGGRFEYSKTKRYSVFNPYLGHGNNNIPLVDEDLNIIKEVYKKGFEERLQKAEQQFSYVLDKLEYGKIITRDRNLWWVKNPIAVIFLPTLVLVLFFIFLTSKIKHAIQVKNELLRFTVLSFVTLLFAGFVIVFCVSFYDFLTTPKSYGFSLVRYDTVFTTAVLLLFLFPFLYLFRFIELKIQNTGKSVFTKTALIFLSTGFLPFAIVSVLFFISIREGQNYQGGYLTLSKMFVGAMIIASLRALISYFVFKERSLIIENETKLSKLRELKSKAELKSLQSQINPHFLYNSLNSIASLAPIDANKTQKMAHSLSDLFKYSINRKGKKMSTVKDEIEMVTSYLNIEKIRFGNRLQFDIEVDETLMNNEIPLFLIQPLVENAVKHGISQNEGEGTIRLKIEKVDNQLVISVNDNGPDFPEGLVSGHGLQTVYDLLRLSYEDSAALHWTNTPEKTITITIPETI